MLPRVDFVVNFQDHINFTIGRQCFNLKQLNNAMVAFKHLLGTSSKQPSIQQAAFLREYLFVYRVGVLLQSWFKSFPFLLFQISYNVMLTLQ